MISYLEGIVKSKDEKSLIVVTSGVGYVVYATASLLHEAKVGEQAEVYTYLDLAMREETMDLYGFSTQEELKFFRQLIKISGVGPRSALGVLSVARIADIKHAIIEGDSALLQKVSGIGKKTSERIVIEMKDKLASEEPLVGVGAAVSGSDHDVYDALAGLGYSVSDIRMALQKIPKDAQTAEERVKAVLKMLGRG